MSAAGRERVHERRQLLDFKHLLYFPPDKRYAVAARLGPPNHPPRSAQATITRHALR